MKTEIQQLKEQVAHLEAILIDLTYVTFDDVIWSGYQEATDLALKHPYLIELHQDKHESPGKQYNLF